MVDDWLNGYVYDNKCLYSLATLIDKWAKCLYLARRIRVWGSTGGSGAIPIFGMMDVSEIGVTNGRARPLP